MPKRMIDTELWNNEDIVEYFTAEDRFFWLYLLTSPHNNICGVFKNSPALIARDMGLHKDTIVNLLYRFENIHKLIYIDKETNEILILNWYKFNWTSSSKLLSLIEKEKKIIKSETIKKLLNERVEIVKTAKKDEKSSENENNEDDTLSVPYQYLSNTNSITTTNTDIQDITNQVSKKVSNKKEKIQSYDEIFDEFGIKGFYKETVIEFIKHLKVSFGIVMLNDRLENLLIKLDFKYGNDDKAKADEVRRAINNGYKRLECEGD